MATSKSSRRPRRKFAALEPRTMHVSQTSIRKRWTRLPINSQSRVKQLFQSIGRSIQHKNGNGDKGVELQSAVDNVANVLTRKVPRMPFPPKTEDSLFDYELTLNRTRVLEAQLTANIHSAGLLKAEIEKEQKLLVEDKAEFEGLEKAFRDAEATRKRHSKGLHPLAKATVNSAGRLRNSGAKVVLESKATTPIIHKSNDDAELGDLLAQVRSHLDSMQNNTRSLEDISTAMISSQAALDSFTWRSLDKERYLRLHELIVT